MSEQLVNDFQFYRNSFENSERRQSIEAEGLFEPAAFFEAVSDPKTTSLTTSSEDKPHTVPLLTPLEHADWFNIDYHKRHAGNDATLFHYSHQSLLYNADPSAYLAALLPGLQRLADQKGVLVLDHNEYETDRIDQELAAITTKLALSFTPVDGPEGATTPHYHYASLAEPIEKEPSLQPSELKNFYEAYEAARAKGELKDTMVTVSPALADGDIEQIWSFYKPVFDELSEEDPIYAGSVESEFISFMKSPECIKFIYKDGLDIVNLCLLMEIKGCQWMNQFYYKDKYPDKYQQGLVFCSPGVIANPNLGRAATSLRTMGMVGTVIKLSGVEPVLTFACDSESNKKVPGLSDISLSRSGIKTDFSKPVGRQIFRMLAVSN